jgi:type I restriction enzyme, S subunit
VSLPTVRLADVTTRIGSGITPRGGSAVYKTAGRPFVHSQNVGWGELRLEDMAYIDDATHMTFPATEIRAGDVLLNITGASIGRSAVATPELDGGNVNQHVCEIRLKRGRIDPYYVNAFLLSRAGQDQIDTFQAGGNRQGLNFQQVGSIRIPDLDIGHQHATGIACRDADSLIAALERRIAKKQAIKQGMMQQLLTGKTRLPGFTDEWQPRRLGSMLSYEQPGRYLVQTTKQLDAGRVPVLTAGKTFFLGYTNEAHGVYTDNPVIIFDDFTTDSQFVDFDFKAKSSAMKILSARSDVDLRFVYERMQLIHFPVGDHKRYWISEYSKQALVVPDLTEQRAISSVITDCDDEIDLLKRRLAKARAVKQGMMQELLTGRTRLPVKETAA